MLLVALAVAGFVGWTILRDKDKARRRRHFSLLLAAGAALLLVKGQWLLALIAGAGAAWVQAQGRFAGAVPPPPAALPDDLAARLAEAQALLGVTAAASVDEINAAHRRLIARNHPDAGGTQGLASRINAARDLLLAHKDRF